MGRRRHNYENEETLPFFDEPTPVMLVSVPQQAPERQKSRKVAFFMGAFTLCVVATGAGFVDVAFNRGQGLGEIGRQLEKMESHPKGLTDDYGQYGTLQRDDNGDVLPCSTC